MNLFMKKVGKITKPTAFTLVGLALVMLLNLVRLDNFSGATTLNERQSIEASSSISNIVDNPVNAPYKMTQLAVSYVSSSITAYRIVSVAIAVITVVFFYRIAKHFFGQKYSSLVTLLFATSSTWLSVSRTISPTIMFVTLFVLVLCGYSLRFNRFKSLSWLFTGVILAAALYVPGMIYFVLAGSIWQYRRVKSTFTTVSPVVLALASVIFLCLISPIIYASSKDINVLLSILAIPSGHPGVVESLKTLVSVPIGLFLYAPLNPELRVGHQPILTLFESAMFLLGVYALIKNHSLDRAKLLIGIASITTLIAAISANFEYTFILLPFVYMILGYGLVWLGKSWFRVFPNNPIAKNFFLALILVASTISVFYHLNRFYVAWPNSPTTKSIFISKEISQ